MLWLYSGYALVGIRPSQVGLFKPRKRYYNNIYSSLFNIRIKYNLKWIKSQDLPNAKFLSMNLWCSDAVATDERTLTEQFEQIDAESTSQEGAERSRQLYRFTGMF